MRFHTSSVVLGIVACLVTPTPTIPLLKQALLGPPQDSVANQEKVRGNNWFYLCSEQSMNRFYIERLDIFPNPPRVNEYTTLRLWGGPHDSSPMGSNPLISWEDLNRENSKPIVLPICETYGMDVWIMKGAPELPGGPFGRSCPPSTNWFELTYHFLVWDKIYAEGNYTNRIKILDSDGENMVCFEGTIDWRK